MVILKNMNEFLAKIYKEANQLKTLTIEEHTNHLIQRIAELKKYDDRICRVVDNEKGFWDDLKIVCLLHDLGKVSPQFQNKLRRIVGFRYLQSNLKVEIPHNYISPVFTIGIYNSLKNDNQRFLSIFFSIAFHHDRKIDFDEKELTQAINELKCFLEQILSYIKEKIPDYRLEGELKNFYYSYLKSYLDENNEIIKKVKSSSYYILLKGLLHRLDYSASAFLPVETERIQNTTQFITKYLNIKYGVNELKTFQKEAEKYRENNIILTASTGSGKTEFALNWLGNDKGFYTLPLRVSTNAMYERVCDIFGSDKVGLLHSDSLFYEIESKDAEIFSFETTLNKINAARQFSLPVTICTADQLFTSVFKYPGYERIYATLAYSKVILDEPQSYSPKTLAMIIRALEEIAQLGCKFCYMSATHHPFVIEKLKNICEIMPPELHQESKHKISLIDKPISESINGILSKYSESKKILVIGNTVKQSQELYTNLKEKCINNLRVNLLHSGFIKKHRLSKENQIKTNFQKDEPVIWITTQIVEASLDIDYDVLFTEIASLDAIIQRMGRIYRKKGRTISDKDNPNVYIYTKYPSDKHFIYNKEISQFTIEAIEKYNEKILSEEDKQKLMNEVFDVNKIYKTSFYKEFVNAYLLLEYGFQSQNKAEAQRLFREINQITGIPESIYSENENLITELIEKTKSNNLEDKLFAISELNNFTLSVPTFSKSYSAEPIFKNSSKDKSIYLILGEYTEYLGLRIEKFNNFL